ncbi:MFS transporter [Pseudactinotalea sp. HY158]|uniref:MFS transporter n=1 Tax=Pseudactinotalea sp. HY158 TaxID=2654547 RepID=UPI00129CAD71|nr:MFS transporter [Pseudactinotalea sp. HY158]QGH68176.1 MFS transporter [Pseudactinotalea sp. HY158]
MSTASTVGTTSAAPHDPDTRGDIAVRHDSATPRQVETGAGPARAGRLPSPARHPWWALVVLMLPVLLVSVDNTVLSFAVPQLSRHLEPSSAQLLWLVDVYPLVLAALLVPMGAAADRWGRRRMLIIGAIGFGAVSVLAAFAPSAGALIVARAGMGLFGAALMPSTLALIRNLFPDARRRRLAIAIWASAFSAGAALGPIVGGFLLEHFHWGSIFLMAVPILLPLLVAGPLLIPESRDPAPGRLDLASVALVAATMAPIVYGITALATGGGAPVALGTIAAGLVAGTGFVRRQLRLEHPLLDVRLFRNLVFTGSVLINLLSVVAIVGFLFFVTQDLQLILGLSPMVAGMALLPGLAATIVAGLLVVPIVSRVRPGYVVAAAFALSALGYGIAALSAGAATPAVLMVAFAVLGAGVGAGETVSNDLILTAAPPHQAGAASAISETAYEVGAVLGTTLVGGLLTAHFRGSIAIPAGVTGADAEAARQTLGGATAVAERLGGGAGDQLLTAAQEAFASGVWLTAGVGTALMAGAVVLALRTLRGVPAR